MSAENVDRVAAEVGEWVRGAWSEDLTLREWWSRLADAGLSQPGWPVPYGRSCSAIAERAVIEQLAAARTIAPPEGGIGAGLAGPALLAHGSPSQQRRYLPALLRGEESWCQLFSEPSAGSDLPSLSTRATRGDDGWVVHGEKVWSSHASVARRGLLLARTNPQEHGRGGISCFVLDMIQAGVEVRPIRQMNGRSSFFTVSLDGAFIPDDDLLGVRHDGWRVARSTLALERANTSRRVPRGLTSVASGELAGNLDRDVRSLLTGEHEQPSTLRRAIPAPELVNLARERGRTNDAVVRDALARYFVLTEVNRLNQRRSPAIHPSITKLLVSRICHLSREVSYSIVGADTMLDGANAALGGALHIIGLGSFGVSIGGGTDEIQRNHIAERVLGLPRDP